MAGRRVLAAAVLAGLGVAGCAGPAGTGSARRPVTTAWLSGVSARSADDAWAVGGFSHAGGSAPLAEHWNGHVWKPVHAGLNNWLDDDDLTGVAATSAARAWTVGTMESQYAWPLTDQWDGRSWTQDPFSMPGVDFGDAWLAGVAVASRKDAWAVGGYGADSGATRTLILRWKGQGWDQVRSPSPAGGGSAAVSQLHAVAALSPVNAWAVGEANTGRGRSARWATVIEHWNGTRWTTVGSPDPSRAGCASDRLSGVAASRGGTWAVGSYCGAPLVLQLTGGRWRQVPCPGTPAGIPARLVSVAVTSRTNAWAVGTIGGRVLILHWNGTKWARAPAPSPAGATSAALAGVSAVSPAVAWAVGQADYPGHVTRLLIEQWNGTTWTLVPVPNPPRRASSGGNIATF